MKIYHSDHKPLDLPAGHPFPMKKYHLLRERVASAGICRHDDLQPAAAATDEDILRVHAPDYFERLRRGDLSTNEMRRIGFPWSPRLVERTRHAAGATLAAVGAARTEGVGINLGGGTHHAFPDYGQGYCILNDVAIGLRAHQARGRIETAVVIDGDAHQGNGTAAIFSGDPSVFTFSIHGRSSFPFHKVPGDLDIALDEGTGDDVYLEKFTDGLARALATGPFDMAVFLAGADPHHSDRFGCLALTRTGLARRDRLVLNACGRHGLPLAIVMSGGYANDIFETVAVHFETVRLAAAMAASWHADGSEPAAAKSGVRNAFKAR
ncbi:MAG: histone deacetylase [Desulfobacterales bacterium]|nr:histone deacetylase [Desulfobacterales bacterium]